MKRLIGKCVLAVAVAMAAALPAQAGTLDDRVPADSLLYVGWAGADALAGDYKGSNLKAIIDASSVGDFVSKKLPEMISKASDNDPDAAKKIAMVQRGLKMMWDHPVAFYFCPVDFTNPRKPGLRFGILCNAGADAKELNDLLSPLVESAPPDPDFKVKLSQEGALTLLSFGKADTVADLKAGGALATAPAYVKAMGQVKQQGEALAVYGDVQKIIAMINDGLNKAPDAPPEVKVKVPAAIAAAGLNGMTQVAMVGGFQGKGWQEHAFIGINGPRTGVLSLIDDTPLPESMLAAVPKDAASFSASRFDLGKLYSEVRKVITVVEPRAIVELDKGIAQVNQELGVNIETDVINAIGHEWVVYRAPTPEGALAFAVINKAKNADALAKAIDTVEKVFNEKSGAPIKVEKVKAGKMEVSALMFLQMNVAWTVRNGYLYVSTLNGIAPAVNQVENKGPSITTSDLYKDVIAKLVPAGVKPTAISYSNPARIYPEVRTAVLGILPLLRAQAKIDVPMDILPEPTEVAPYMTPGGMISWSDASGVHAVTSSAFPGAALLAGQNPGATAVAGAAGGAAFLWGQRATVHQAAIVEAQVLP